MKGTDKEETREYIAGCVAEAPNGNRWVRHSESLWWTNPSEGASPLDDGQVHALGLTVTFPKTYPVVVEGVVEQWLDAKGDAEYVVPAMLQELSGKDVLIVLKEAVVNDYRFSGSGMLSVYSGQRVIVIQEGPDAQ